MRAFWFITGVIGLPAPYVLPLPLLTDLTVQGQPPSLSVQNSSNPGSDLESGVHDDPSLNDLSV